MCAQTNVFTPTISDFQIHLSPLSRLIREGMGRKGVFRSGMHFSQ